MLGFHPSVFQRPPPSEASAAPPSPHRHRVVIVPLPVAATAGADSHTFTRRPWIGLIHENAIVASLRCAGDRTKAHPMRVATQQPGRKGGCAKGPWSGQTSRAFRGAPGRVPRPSLPRAAKAGRFAASAGVFTRAGVHPASGPAPFSEGAKDLIQMQHRAPWRGGVVHAAPGLGRSQGATLDRRPTAASQPTCPTFLGASR